MSNNRFERTKPIIYQGKELPPLSPEKAAALDASIEALPQSYRDEFAKRMAFWIYQMDMRERKAAEEQAS